MVCRIRAIEHLWRAWQWSSTELLTDQSGLKSSVDEAELGLGLVVEGWHKVHLGLVPVAHVSLTQRHVVENLSVENMEGVWVLALQLHFKFLTAWSNYSCILNVGPDEGLNWSFQVGLVVDYVSVEFVKDFLMRMLKCGNSAAATWCAFETLTSQAYSLCLRPRAL